MKTTTKKEGEKILKSTLQLIIIVCLIFLEMHCALIKAAGAKAKVINSKALCKRIGTLYHNV